jgi:hypothetical protein
MAESAASKRVCSKCRTNRIRWDSKTGLCLGCYKEAVTVPAPVIAPPTPAEQITEDRARLKAIADMKAAQAKYEAAVQIIERQENELGWLAEIRNGVDTTYRIEAREGSGTSEGTPVIIASDWHAEETVLPAQVSGLNQANLEIVDARITRFWQASLNLVRKHLNPGIHIREVVIALLGDFITGQIHGAENAEANSLLPVDAIIWVQNRIIAGIDFWLNHSPYTLVIPCKVGNHTRTTLRTRFGSEQGHSLETLMYIHLAGYYRNEPRVKFVIDNGYHTYLDIYDMTVRLHHGHAIKYQGGIGGLFIPAYKAVSAWSKARWADLDIFGHFHQSKDGGSFICNGSLIGYNAFALSIKADYEPPKQTLILLDKHRGRTSVWPILLEKCK